jgi:hypothetical protein
MPAAVRRMDEYMENPKIVLKEMAHRCGLSLRTLQNFRAQGWLKRGSLEKVAKVLGLSLEDFCKD